MPRDGSGVHSLPAGYLAISGQTIQPSQHNPPLEDISAALTDSISRTGVTAITANIPMGGFKLTGLGDATSSADAMSRQFSDGRYGNLGQCYLALNAGNLLLSAAKGNRLSIAGVPEIIPSAGVTLAATGLTPGTVYYIYAYMNAGTMTLEASTTAYAIGTTSPYIGWATKSGDTTRTLVGQADCVTGPAWVDSSTRVGVLSWFNRTRKTSVTTFTANRSVASGGGTAAEVNSEIRNTFLAWPDEYVTADAVGAWQVTGAATGYSEIIFDAGSAGSSRPSATATATATSLALARTAALNTGRHYATIYAYAVGGTNVVFIGAVDGRTSLAVHVNG